MTTITVQPRETTGKGFARRSRLEGITPGVIYGNGMETSSINVNSHDLDMAIQKGSFFSSMQSIKMDGKTMKVLPRDVQYDPVSGKVLHIDFMRLDPKKRINVEVYVRVEGEAESPGIKHGGIVQLVRPSVELLCRPDNIPQELVLSVADMDIGDSLHISSIELPDGVEPVIQDRDFTVASIISTRTSSASEEDAEAAEGEEAAEDEEGSSEETSSEETKESGGE